MSLALLVVRSAQQQDLPSIQLLSPVADQQLARAQDLVVKYAIADDGHACRVVLVINGRVVGTHEGCKLSVLVPEYELVLGSNLVEVIRQGDDYYNYEEQEASVTFAVVEPKQWPSVPSGGSRGASDAREACSQHDAACSRGACIHQVSDMCILYEDEWAREKGAIPRILHWVWVGGGGDIPAKFHPMMESWRRLHPNWQAVVWTDEKVTWELRNQALMLQADTYAELSDIVRLEVVERFGGVYVDTDFQALQVVPQPALSSPVPLPSLIFELPRSRTFTCLPRPPPTMLHLPPRALRYSCERMHSLWIRCCRASNSLSVPKKTQTFLHGVKAREKSGCARPSLGLSKAREVPESALSAKCLGLSPTILLTPRCAHCACHPHADPACGMDS